MYSWAQCHCVWRQIHAELMNFFFFFFKVQRLQYLTHTHTHTLHLSLNHGGHWGTRWLHNQIPQLFFFSNSPLPSGIWPASGLSIPWCCLSASSSVWLVFFPLSLSLVRWFWPDLMNGRHVQTTSVCISLWGFVPSHCLLNLGTQAHTHTHKPKTNKKH